jgi:hypothetical protein
MIKSYIGWRDIEKPKPHSASGSKIEHKIQLAPDQTYKPLSL